MRHTFATYTRAETHLAARLEKHGHNPELYNLEAVVDTHNLRTKTGFIAVIMDIPAGDIINMVAPHTWNPMTVRYDLHTGELTLLDEDGQELITERMENSLPLIAEIRRCLAARGVHTTVGEGLVATTEVLAGARS